MIYLGVNDNVAKKTKDKLNKLKATKDKSKKEVKSFKGVLEMR